MIQLNIALLFSINKILIYIYIYIYIYNFSVYHENLFYTTLVKYDYLSKIILLKKIVTCNFIIHYIINCRFYFIHNKYFVIRYN